MAKKTPNDLIGEHSPYLLQHAHNPVWWKAWNEETLREAEEKGKLLIISIGYAACHWCHVMEHESFEDSEVAKVMNSHFVNIKVDREERPDVDQIYMDALQLMTGRGGWPLNIVAMPDGRPFWGTTYLPREEWKKVLLQLHQLWLQEPQKVEEYAEKLTSGVRAINLLNSPDTSTGVSPDQLSSIIDSWTQRFDQVNGGFAGAPKFMMPVILDFLLHYSHITKEDAIYKHVHLSLEKMAMGGLYDQIGGGFSRYSVDERWHIPHFEKMLYDNAQLIGTYARGFAQNQNPLYKKVIHETVDFLLNELRDKNGGFYASLDADSLTDDGKLREGAFYRWTLEEVKQVTGDDFELAIAYFNFNEHGYWEDGYYVPVRTRSLSEIAAEFKMEEATVTKKIDRIRLLLKTERDKRARPRLDNKIICSWNALMISGLFEASRYLGSEDYRKIALETLDYLHTKHRHDDTVYRTVEKGKSGIPGFLEDYAGLLLAYVQAYEVTFETRWLTYGRSLCDIIIQKFYDPKSKLFFFTTADSGPLIRRTLETNDNVIPSSNSTLLQALFILSKHYPGSTYETHYKQMTEYIPGMLEQPYSYAHWLRHIIYTAYPFYEVAVTGTEYEAGARSLQKYFLPNTLFAAGNEETEIPLLKNRTTDAELVIYLCENGHCNLPVHTVNEALKQLNSP